MGIFVGSNPLKNGEGRKYTIMGILVAILIFLYPNIPPSVVIYGVNLVDLTVIKLSIIVLILGFLLSLFAVLFKYTEELKSQSEKLSKFEQKTFEWTLYGTIALIIVEISINVSYYLAKFISTLGEQQIFVGLYSSLIFIFGLLFIKLKNRFGK